ncbi:NADPH-dependent diflavin oxidoreductase [Achlya hypogyna]|uniref:NADPH-dependent diflavin oxidoreductase n=1 Tax=Achlya hypogyna TaxID=1202772 RepID=A0A1V9Z6X7_ACHHY|nr:NADPH-dependent diflavin oxidoreductase [Achlya hypogyna]
MAALHVLYGSATGTAQDVAEQIGRMATARNVPSVVSPLDDFPIASLPSLEHVVFVVASSGDGEAPENMTQSWKFLLRKSLASDSLATVRVAVFGLGDSSYAKYNAVARRLQVLEVTSGKYDNVVARLVQLGATEIIERGLGDDQHELGYHGALNPWLEKLWAVLLATEPFRLPAGFVVDDSPKMTAPIYRVSTAESGEPVVPHTFYAPPKTVLPGHNGKILMATVTTNARLTAADWSQDVRHLALDMSASPVAYAPGDIALLYPENVDTPAIDACIARFGLVRGTQLRIERVDGQLADVPSPVSVDDLFRKYLDVFGTPRRSFFERLSLFAADDEEREKLLELASPGGKCNQLPPPLTPPQVLDDFPSCHVPMEFLLEFIPRLQPRSYSIASAARVHPHTIELTVALVGYLTPYKRPKRGICSAYLADLPVGTTLALWLKSGLFAPPPPAANVLLVGPGTGVAVMRALLQDRSAGSGENHLYFGCRHASQDFLYESEWNLMVSNGSLASLHVAFSRDQGHKLYVQAKLAASKATVFRVLANGGYCFVAGSAKRMPTDVYEAIRDIVASEGQVSLKDAEKFMKTLVRQKRYVVESWS